MGHIISIASVRFYDSSALPARTHERTYPLSHLPSASNRNGTAEMEGPEHMKTCPIRMAFALSALLLLATIAIHIELEQRRQETPRPSRNAACPSWETSTTSHPWCTPVSTLARTQEHMWRRPKVLAAEFIGGQKVDVKLQVRRAVEEPARLVEHFKT